jgi:HlyD family secretion protein
VTTTTFRRGLWVAGLLALALLARLTVLRPAAVPVTVFKVARGRVEETVTNSKAGTVKSRRRATLSPEIGGRVLGLPARKGAAVKRGEVLLRIADGDYRAQVSLQESAVAAARSDTEQACWNARQAEKDFERNQPLARSEVVSPELLDQLRSRKDAAVAACDAARARIGQAEAALQVARVNLEKTVLKAPFDGVVADVTTEVGEWITPSPPGLPIPPVIVLLDPDSIYISAPMDEVDVARVKVGQPARVTIDAYPGRTFPGNVTRVAPYVQDVQQQNRTFEIEVELADRAFASSLLPGTSADVEVILASREDVLRIPSYALLEGNRVLVVKNGRLTERSVAVGVKNWQFAEILRGLAAGEDVVVSLDRPEVKAGARVRIEGEPKK